MTEEQIFITDDKWLRDTSGIIDPDDKAIIDALEKQGPVVRLSSADAFKKMQEEGIEDVGIKEAPDIDDGFVKLTPEMVQKFREDAPKVFSTYEIFFKAVMRQRVAELIRRWRAQDHRSWRSIARKAFNYWPEWVRWDPPSNQIVGMALCKIAADYLGEDYFQDPWN